MRGLMSDRINLIKQDGNRVDDIEASVQENKILINDISIQVDAGDQVERPLDNGKVELYEVLEAHYLKGPSGGGSAVSHIKLDVRKGDRKPDSEGDLGDSYHFHGPNARVNQAGAVDQSVNIADSNFGDVIADCRQKVDQAVGDEDAKQDILDRLTKLEEARQAYAEGDGSEEDLGKAYNQAVAKLANHTGLLSFCWSLSQAAAL